MNYSISKKNFIEHLFIISEIQVLIPTLIALFHILFLNAEFQPSLKFNDLTVDYLSYLLERWKINYSGSVYISRLGSMKLSTNIENIWKSLTLANLKQNVGKMQTIKHLDNLSFSTINLMANLIYFKGIQTFNQSHIYWSAFITSSMRFVK